MNRSYFRIAKKPFTMLRNSLGPTINCIRSLDFKLQDAILSFEGKNLCGVQFLGFSARFGSTMERDPLQGPTVSLGSFFTWKSVRLFLFS